MGLDRIILLKGNKYEWKKICEINNAIKIFAENSLEEYRAQSFYTKEPETVLWIEKFFNKGNIFFNIGANIGIYSLYAAHLFPGSKVFSFEPYRKNFNRLCENIKLNELSNIYPILCGLSEKSSIEIFFIKDERSGASGSQIGVEWDEHGNRFEVLDREIVPVFTLDDFIKNLNTPFPNHIKIDVDGIENLIINGMCETLADERLLSVLVEINQEAFDGRQIREIFIANGFNDKHELNFIPQHSRSRRKGTVSESAENVIFTRNK